MYDNAVGASVFAGGYFDGFKTWTLTVSVPPPPIPHDNRYFAQTGFRIDNATIWDYVTHRGGVTTFGYPTSRTFEFEGFTTQFFQRRVV